MPDLSPTQRPDGLSGSASRGRRARWWLPALGIVVATAWALGPALHGGWIWDDSAEYLHSPEIRDPAGLGKIWFAPAGVDYFPLKTSVQWLQWHLWQDRVLGYHLTNVALHLASALLLWRLLRKLGVALAWFGGLLFAVHPLVVESVAWLAELKNTVSLPLLLLAMDAYVDFDARHRRADYGRALALFAAAMLAKTSVVMFPVVILLHAWWRRGRIARADLKASAPFFAVSLVLGLVTVWFQHQRAIGEGVVLVQGFLPRVAGAGLAIAFYLGKSVWPAGLLPVYPRWIVDPPSPVQFLPWLALVAVLGWLWTRRAMWGRHALFGLGFFLVNLAPVLGFVTMSYLHIAWVADHFVYLPLLGLVGLATAGAGAAVERRAPPGRAYVIGGLVAVAAVLAYQSHRYAWVFRDEKTFWAYTLERNRGAWVAHNNLGNALLEDGREEEAVAHFAAALALKPDYASAHYNWANALARQRRLPEAAAHYEAALRLTRDYTEAHINLGNTLVLLGRDREAATHYEAALRLAPDHAGTHRNLAVLLARTGQLAEAMAHFDAALRLQPRQAATHVDLADALLRAGQLADAIAHYEMALQLQPGSAVAHNSLGYALAQTGRPAEAVAQFAVALQGRPDYPEAQLNWGNVLLQAGRVSDAIDHYQEALRLRPDYGEVHCNLGIACFLAERPAEARRHFEAALRLNPDDAQVQEYLRRVPPAGARSAP